MLIYLSIVATLIFVALVWGVVTLITVHGTLLSQVQHTIGVQWAVEALQKAEAEKLAVRQRLGRLIREGDGAALLRERIKARLQKATE